MRKEHGRSLVSSACGSSQEQRPRLTSQSLCPHRSFWLVDGALRGKQGLVPQQLRDQDLRRADSNARDEGASGTREGICGSPPPPDPQRAAASARPGAPQAPAHGGLRRAGLETGSVTPLDPRRAKQAPTKIYLFYLNLVRGPARSTHLASSIKTAPARLHRAQGTAMVAADKCS